MRALLLVAVAGGVAEAGPPAECRAVNDKTIATTDLGCFEALTWKDDYAYGTRVCLLRTDTDVCAGVAALFVGPVRFDAQRLDRVSCGGNGNTITLKGVWGSCDMAGNCTAIPIAFNGVLAGDHLTGMYTEGETKKKKVTWVRTRKKHDTRALVRNACKRPRAENRRRDADPDNPFVD